MRHNPKPWIAAGMSRASWYRHGKPATKPHRRTQAESARIAGVSVRTIQRIAHAMRERGRDEVWAQHFPASEPEPPAPKTRKAKKAKAKKHTPTLYLATPGSCKHPIGRVVMGEADPDFDEAEALAWLAKETARKAKKGKTLLED
jgi:hypothetical protein